MQTEVMKVTGMTCGGCTSKVARALRAIAGVGEVDVSLSSNQATVQYDEKTTSPAQLRSAVTSAGYDTHESNMAASKPAKKGCCS